ncbi:hypothetical protein [Myroides sp. DF42-4-2]|uniref:hypothetical protein n=1 Tax=unclassified Myroides TaxID=2642485 RepID=UPI002579201C|nr:hypothetical protein [Myroides sp. DF42-4-2]MDM1408338.1 hypothetical protein [Myroides sp. DF42-4-2]
MKKIITSIFITTIFLFYNCNSSDEIKPTEDNHTVINKPFTEGIVEMGIFSKDVDLGKIIGKIDFSREDITQQYQDLLTNDAEARAIFEVVEDTSNQNPLVAWAMSMNISECTYFIKDKVVLGNVRGFGWNMHNYHNTAEDKGSIYLETVTQLDKIAEQDRKIYTEFKPSENAGANATNTIDFSEFNRQVEPKKQNVLGYECDVIIYTPKKVDNTMPMQLQKIAVYTSPLFSNTINFTHPFYLEENNGILRLDIYYLNNEEPTLVMKPKAIKEQVINQQDLISKTSTPIYSSDDMNWGFKALAIMMSGWGAVEN